MRLQLLSVILSLLMFISTISIGSIDAFADTNPSGVVHSKNTSDISNGSYRRVSSAKEEIEITSGEYTPRTLLDLPESFDSRKNGYVTPVKNQGAYGCCWAMGAMAASEASLIFNNGYKADDLDLSELHLAYYTYNDGYDSLGLLRGDSSKVSSVLNTGGMHYMSVMALARWAGVVNEKTSPEFAFSKASESFDIEDKTTAYSQNIAIIDDAYWIYMPNQDHVKAKIMEYGGGVIPYYVDDHYFNSNTAAYYYNGTQISNHEVCVIGWDDNYPKENFLEHARPKNNGAWLVKNSYGSWYGDNGYFWLSYEDVSLNKEDACFISYKDVSTYDNNYQHDGSVIFADYSDHTNLAYGGYTGGGYMANAFTAQSKEALSAVSFFTYETNVNYEINIYTDIPNGATTPTAGKAVYTTPLSGKRTYSGYHTIELPESIVLDEGENFSVIVRIFKDPDTLVSLMCDVSDQWNWITFVNYTKPGQSYFSTNGSSWRDLSASGINFRVKAFTKDIVLDTESDTTTETDTLTDTETETDTATETDTVTDTETDTATETDTLTDTETDTATETDTLTDTETDTATETDTVTDTETDTATETDTLTDTETDTATETDTLTDTETDTTTEPDTDIPMKIILGDVDCNGEVNMIDVTVLQKIIAQLQSYSDYNTLSEKQADVNDDGKVSMEDVVMMQRHIAKLINLNNNAIITFKKMRSIECYTGFLPKKILYLTIKSNIIY